MARECDNCKRVKYQAELRLAHWKEYRRPPTPTESQVMRDKALALYPLQRRKGK